MTNRLRHFYMACAITVVVMFSLGNTTQGTLLTEFASFYKINAFTQSFISAAASFGMGLAVFGLLALKQPVTKNFMYVIAVGVVALSFALIGMMPAFPFFLCFYTLLGVAFGYIDSIGSSLMADVSTHDRISRNMGLLHAFYGLGGMLGPVLIRGTADIAGKNSGTGGVTLAIYLLAGLASVLLIVNIAGFSLVKRDSPDTLKRPVPLKLSEFFVFLRSGAVPLLLTTALYGSYLNVTTFRMAQYITVDFGSDTLGALSLSALWAGIIISRLSAPRVGLKLRIYLICGMSLAAAFTAFGVILNGAAAVCVTAFFAGLFGGAVIPMCISELCVIVPDNTLLASGSALLALDAGQLVGAVIAGALTPDSKLGVGLLIAAAYILLGAVSAAFYHKRPASVIQKA